MECDTHFQVATSPCNHFQCQSSKELLDLQKFGVKQKEKIASFKTSVDVLTLSATPIPRTLYLALTGFRDASLISTPPPERVPIKTHLSAFSKEKVVSAIKYELDRDGQVFYVLPRIKGLDEVMKFLELSFPDVEIAVAHGKEPKKRLLKWKKRCRCAHVLPAYIDWLLCVHSSLQQYSKQLEGTMDRFAQGEIKVLICTNIVESGLDMQNANTIIIQDIQQFGLAQLYQACYSLLFKSLPYPFPCYLASSQFRHEGSLFPINVLITVWLLDVMTPQMLNEYAASL
ncbi:hypothetical protein Cgig2_014897 [Carnegiea gigantea]|uniref:Helicase C-terminal domain-containing protein n=1 Tax=Carnegiea gigantea TaxID=171969 RepID=A0A9Q1GNB9_9CARY|nr:hypothetical protein Cgig2_014897 [Carnegiea gigantea]